MFDYVLTQRDIDKLSTFKTDKFKILTWDSDQQLKDLLNDGKRVLLITDKSDVLPDLFNLSQVELVDNHRFFHFSEDVYKKDGHFPGDIPLDICADYYEDSGIYYLKDNTTTSIHSYAPHLLFTCAQVRPETDYRPGLFFDRDGVLNVDHSYVHKIEDLELIDGASDFISDPELASFVKFIVTNQSGVARGMFNVDEVNLFNQELVKKLNVSIDGIEVSPYYFDKGIGEYKMHSLTRKPHPGMVLKLMHQHAIDLGKSFMIGDKASDKLEVPLLKTIFLKGNYDLSKAQGEVCSNFSEVKNLVLMS
jgi:D-glycero-D-manno-heptose 1,7-bisphosphate phosphatase